MIPFLLVNVATILLLGGSMLAMPSLSRPDIDFSVLVSPSFHRGAEAAAIRRRYRLEVAIHTAIALAILLATPARWMPAAMIASVVWSLAGTLHAFLHARGRVLPHAAPPSLAREASLQPRTPHLPGGAIGQLVPFLILAAAAAWLRLHWSSIPERFPIHWDASGVANGFATRSVAGVGLPLFIGLAVTLLQAGIASAIAHARSTSATGAPALRERRSRAALLAMLVAIEYIVAIVFAAVALFPLRAHPEQSPSVTLIVLPVFAVIVIGTIMIARAIRSVPGDATTVAVGDGTLDEHWKGGLFYVNADDPALFVEKRFGIGYTLNFGHPKAWLMMLVLLLFIGIAIVLPILAK